VATERDVLHRDRILVLDFGGKPPQAARSEPQASEVNR
jgi:hypothetical protein